jgi:hypothetical protein
MGSTQPPIRLPPRFFLESKAVKSDVDVPLPSRSEVQNSGAITLVPINALIECKGTTLHFIMRLYCEHNINVSFIKAGYVWDLDSISYFRGARASWSFFPLILYKYFFRKFAWIAESKNYYKSCKLELFGKVQS